MPRDLSARVSTHRALNVGSDGTTARFEARRLARSAAAKLWHGCRVTRGHHTTMQNACTTKRLNQHGHTCAHARLHICTTLALPEARGSRSESEERLALEGTLHHCTTALSRTVTSSIKQVIITRQGEAATSTGYAGSSQQRVGGPRVSSSSTPKISRNCSPKCAPVPVRPPMLRCVQVGSGSGAARCARWPLGDSWPWWLGPVETQRAGHLGTSHPRKGLAWWLERQNLVKPACVATSAQVAVIAETEATAWEHVSETAETRRG